VACVDGLTGFPDAIEAVFPQAWVQTCLVHLVRASLRFVPYRDKRAVASDLKKIYTAVDQDAAADELQRFAEKWDPRYPTISRGWREHWERIIPFLAFPPDVRRAVYTTDENVKRSVAPVGLVFGSGIGRAGCSQGRGSAPVVSFPDGPAGIGPVSGMRRLRRRLRRAGRDRQRALGCAVGVVDPRAKRRIWG
jgi:hypothetical protein